MSENEESLPPAQDNPPADVGDLPEAPVPELGVGDLPEEEGTYVESDVIEEPVTPTDEDGNPIKPDRPEEYISFSIPRGPSPYTLPLGGLERVFTPAKNEEEAETEFHVSAIPCGLETFNSMSEAYPSINYSHGNLSREWSTEVFAASQLFLQANFLSKRIDKEGSKWSLRIPHGASTIGPRRPSLPVSPPGSKISGDQANALVIRELGYGQGVTIPLYHSGIWIELECPTLEARMLLQRRIDMEKAMLGRTTHGIAYSNLSVYVKNYLVDFVLAHVKKVNVRVNQMQDLKDIILVTDIPAMLWGMLMTMHPDGYPYHQPCVNDPSKCQHIIKEKIDLTKIYFVDTQKLTEAQVKYMVDTAARRTTQEIDQYRNDHYYVPNSTIHVPGRTVNGKPSSLTMTLKVPTLNEYFAGGMDWVEGTVQAIDRAFGTNLRGDQREQYILDRVRVTNMCEYSHWVKEIVTQSGSVVSDEESIRSILARISGDAVTDRPFFDEIMKYMENVTIGLAALPRFDCPACGNPPTVEERAHPYLNPIDIEQFFFILVGHHIVKAIPA